MLAVEFRASVVTGITGAGVRLDSSFLSFLVRVISSFSRLCFFSWPIHLYVFQKLFWPRGHRKPWTRTLNCRGYSTRLSPLMIFRRRVYWWNLDVNSKLKHQPCVQDRSSCLTLSVLYHTTPHWLRWKTRTAYWALLKQILQWVRVRFSSSCLLQEILSINPFSKQNLATLCSVRTGIGFGV